MMRRFAAGFAQDDADAPLTVAYAMIGNLLNK